MEHENDLILSALTVRIRDTKTSLFIGSGIIYYRECLNNCVYVITASHCLYEDVDGFTIKRDQVEVDFYNPVNNSYTPLTHIINYKLTYPETDKDVGILVFDKEAVVRITGKIPEVLVSKERQSVTSFVMKGFPSATLGEELVCIYPTWIQEMTGVEKFQLNLEEDYKKWSTKGFSGSGVFLHSNGQLYLYGIFTRLREENRGKVMYCQYINTVNDLLNDNFLPTISISFFGEYGLTPNFFYTHIDSAVKNLGPRFNNKLNFRLPIAQRFHDIAKDEYFKNKLLGCFDKWLIARNEYHKSKENLLLERIENEYSSLKEVISSALLSFDWTPNKNIELDPFLLSIQQFNEVIEKKRSELFSKQWEEEKKENINEKDFTYRAPYSKELSRLREILDTNSDLLISLDEVNIKLANNPLLLIDGEAGSGKSHLLGDIAVEQIKQGYPTLLFLGQLLKGSQNVWQNLLAQLGLSCTSTQFLNSLNNIGKQIGSRVLILIDALNEGAGKELWFNELAGFINDVSRYQFIGLVLTVRSTYLNTLIPIIVQKDPRISRITHEGFKGNEYAALNLFCNYYGLQQPTFPILAPEFTSPLFLQIICEGLNESKQKVFPPGFQGILKIFDFYLTTISRKLSEKREEYLLRSNLTKQAITTFAHTCFLDSESRFLELEKAIQLFDEKFERYRYLLNDLIFENVFIQSIHREYSSENEVDIILFTYERFGDYIIAQKLLENYSTKDEVKVAFAKDATLGKLIENGYWENNGILEAMSVLLPEKYNLEIVEVFDWIFDDNLNSQLWNYKKLLSIMVLESFKWRTIQSIDDKKITAWLRNNKSEIPLDAWFRLLAELTALPDHPLNSDRLHETLKRVTMPKRDSFWQQHLLLYHGVDDNGNGFPIKRLIDWAWQPNISSLIESEIARLTGQTLAWVLSSTNRILRDKATKALVNLLEEQPDALISILKAFEGIDEMYISERLFAVAYGCSLRTSSNDSRFKIAQYVFDQIFRKGNPPSHILLRDYARNTVEYALYKGLAIEGDVKLIRPPYKSTMPEIMPLEEEINKFKVEYDTPDYKIGFGSASNQIYHSVMGGDFGRYIVDSSLTYFSPLRFTFESEYKAFLKKLKAKDRKLVKDFLFFYESYNHINSRIKSEKGIYYNDIFLKFSKGIRLYFLKIEEEIKRTLSVNSLNFLNEKLLPYFAVKQQLTAKNHPQFNAMPIRRWIVNRVFELGFDPKLHGLYESNSGINYYRYENKIERIGKKYQWIAYYEIMARICDNYKIVSESSNERKHHYYRGPWQFYWRNIDPVFTSKKETHYKQNKDDDFGVVNSDSVWWFDKKYNYWNLPLDVWIDNVEDLPNPDQFIQRTDDKMIDWLYLGFNSTWKEPKPVGQERHNVRTKEFWYYLKAFLVKKNEKNRIIKWLTSEKLSFQDLPRKNTPSQTYSRENYWAPICSENEYNRKIWQIFASSSYKTIIAINEAVGEISGDQSGARFMYEMPCQKILDGMKLKHSTIDGEFENDLGEVVVSNSNPYGILIRKTDLVDFLANQNLELLWVFMGEKSLHGGKDRSNNTFRIIYGVYCLENNKVQGSFSLSKYINN